jgi:hypothetical protein
VQPSYQQNFCVDYGAQFRSHKRKRLTPANRQALFHDEVQAKLRSEPDAFLYFEKGFNFGLVCHRMEPAGTKQLTYK